jgi:hypothetical protein
MRFRVPVGIGLPLPPLTATVTVNDCAVVICDEERVNVTAGVSKVTSIEANPDELL